MPTREEKIAFIKAQSSQANHGSVASKPMSREEKIAFIKAKAEQSPDESGFLKNALNTVIETGRTIDSYTGAPTRAAISAAQNTENPIAAFGKQFGEDPDLAPTGKQIVQKAGVPDTALSEVAPSLYSETGDEWLKFKKGGAADITASGATGLAVDVVADPTTLIPFGATKKVISGGAKAIPVAGELALKGANKIPGAKTVSTTIDVAREGAKNTAQALRKMFTPRQADDFKGLVEIAKKNGIDPKLLPESVEFGENSFISRAARHKAEGTLGQNSLEKFHAGLEAVRDATENKIAKISGGNVPSTIEAGELIRNGFDDGVDKFFNQVGMTHNKVMEAIPGLQIAPESLQQIDSKLNGIEKWAKGRSVRGFTATQRGQADQVLRAIEAVREGSGSYKQTLETLRDIGEVAFKTKGQIYADISPDVAKFRDLYFTIDDALINTVERSAGSQVAAELRESNKMISEFLGDKSVISHIVGNKNMSPERVFASLVEQGDTKKIQALKKILPPETFQKLKGSFLESQIKRNADDVFTFKGLHNSLRNKKNIVGALLDANEIDELSELIRLGDRFGNPVLSSSGTGASNVFRDVTKSVGNAVANDTVIGMMKDSARGRTLKETAQAAQIVAKETPQLAAGVSLSSQNLKRLAAVSPAAARTISIHSKDGEQSPVGALKGQKKWAVDGYAKLSDHDRSGIMKDEKLVRKLFSSPKGKMLLQSASDLKPGSKAMGKILDQIQNQYGEANK